MGDIGRITGPTGSPHEVKPTTAKPAKGMPATYEDAFASSKVQDIQASSKAFMKETDKENPLAKRTIKPFKKGEYPHGKTLPGFAEVHPNRMS